MRFEIIALFAAAATASAQAVSGTAYGFAKGTTGGGSAKAVTPTNAQELAKLLADNEPRVILIDKEYDFTGTSATGSGCDRKSCSANNGGQLYLGDLSCGGSDNVPVSSIKYDTAGPTALKVGSNKSILGVGGKGALKGKGLSLQKGASNIIIQGITFSTINPGIVWGGDALEMQGGNDGVWVDHCKFSTTGRMFVVSHYSKVRLTLSNNEFDGVTSTSASCNGNHYWTMMFYGDGDQVTLHQNYFHDVSGRAPKLGEDGVSGTFHAVNNYFENMKGHAFDAYNGASALVEGNVFKAVNQPATSKAASVSTFVVNAGSACSAALGRSCMANNVDSSSGKLTGGSSSGFISKIASYDVKPRAVSEVAAYVRANAGPAHVGSGNAIQDAVEETPAEEEPATNTPTPTSPIAVESPATTPEPVTTPALPSTAPSSGVAKMYAQCGGQGFSGPTECESGATCVKSNDWYSQCIASAKFRRVL